MIVGIGTDLVEIPRVTEACMRESFMKRIYTEAEAELIAADIKKASGNFAVKEAVAKMFGTGFFGCEPKEIEVLRDSIGKPYVNLYGKALDLAKSKEIHKIHVTITNTKDYASAFVVGERVG